MSALDFSSRLLDSLKQQTAMLVNHINHATPVKLANGHLNNEASSKTTSKKAKRSESLVTEDVSATIEKSSKSKLKTPKQIK